MDSSQKQEKRMELIVNEICECREDDRDTQEQILQTIATGGAILGILTGASFAQEMAAYARWLFFLSGIVFLVIFGNVISLGMGNVIRYHYLQDLEDQLCEMLGGREEMVVFWKSFSSPVMTRNYKHLKNRYAYMSFGSITVAAVFALLFCLVLMVLLFFRMQPWSLVDRILGVFFTVSTVICAVVYFEVSSKGQEMFAYCKEYSLKAREKRHSKENREPQAQQSDPRQEEIPQKPTKGQVLQMITYYLYPRLCDLQKPCLMVIGYLIGWLLFGGMGDETVFAGLPRLFWSWFVVDFLVYQSRFLWNDIRGWHEDKRAGKTNRIPAHILGTGKAVWISLMVSAVKLVLAAIIMIFVLEDTLGWMLLLVIAVIAVTAVCYELASDHAWVPCVYTLVSVGYPVRLATGLFAAKPDLFSAEIICGGCAIPKGVLIFLIVAYGLLGVFSSLLSWAHQAVRQKRILNTVTKTYYQPLLNQLGKRSEEKDPLKEKGKLKDGWNLVFLFSVLALSVMVCWTAIDRGVASEMLMVMVMEAVLLIFVMAICCAKQGRITMFTVLAGVVIIGKAIVMALTVQWGTFYVLICCNQLFAVILYFGLRYLFDPDFDFVKAVKEILWMLLTMIIGKKTMELIAQETEEKASRKTEKV